MNLSGRLNTLKIYLVIPFFYLLIIINLSKCNSEPILELNDTNFEEYKAKNEYLLIYFHASYSQESISLQKHFIEIPKYLNKTKPIVYGIISQKNYYVNHKYIWVEYIDS